MTGTKGITLAKIPDQVGNDKNKRNDKDKINFKKQNSRKRLLDVTTISFYGKK